MVIKNYFLILSTVMLVGAGCIGQEAPAARPQASIEEVAKTCTASIDISKVPDNKTAFKKASFTYPCEWENGSTKTILRLAAPNGAATITYPTLFEGDLPMNGTDTPLLVAGEAHTRYISVGSPEISGDMKTQEVIRGPLFDQLGTRPYYSYPNGSSVGDQIARIFASLTLE